MPNAADLTLDRVTKNVSMLLKGPFGFGKTLAAASMAVDGPIWLAYWDKKEPIELLNFFKKHRPEALKNIDYNCYSSNNVHEYLSKLYDLSKSCSYYGVINDSVTMMTSSAVNWSIGFRNKSGPKKDDANQMAIQMIPGFDEYKTETGLVTQALDIYRTLPCNVIWTAHPITALDMSGGAGTGQAMRVNKVTKIVSYGTKVGEIVPANFTEIYHFSTQSEWDSVNAKSRLRRLVSTVPLGEDFAKTALDLPADFDITDKLFWEVWKEAVLR